MTRKTGKLDQANRRAPQINPEHSGMRSGNKQLDPKAKPRRRGERDEHRPEAEVEIEGGRGERR